MIIKLKHVIIFIKTDVNKNKIMLILITIYFLILVKHHMIPTNNPMTIKFPIIIKIGSFSYN
jgi:hypothetical protein